MATHATMKQMRTDWTHQWDSQNEIITVVSVLISVSPTDGKRSMQHCRFLTWYMYSLVDLLVVHIWRLSFLCAQIQLRTCSTLIFLFHRKYLMNSPLTNCYFITPIKFCSIARCDLEERAGFVFAPHFLWLVSVPFIFSRNSWCKWLAWIERMNHSLRREPEKSQCLP